MKRDPQKLVELEYDLVVVGAGIHGACIARDAALRGLHVALIDRGDFGSQTSHNSLKLIHGGLRYLQHLDFQRVRQSVRERRFWLRMAPHLVRPLEFVVPTYGHGTRGPQAFWAAIKVHELIGFDRNLNVLDEHRVPSGRLMSKSECLRLIPGIWADGLTGGVVWYDGQMQDADRVLRECVLSAHEAGADVCNYVRAEGWLGNGTCVQGVQARDLLTGDDLTIRGGFTVNACGPWVSSLLQSTIPGLENFKTGALSKCMNIVTRSLNGDYAFGIASQRKSDAVVGRSSRLFFVTPWRDCSVIGTTHAPYTGHPDECQFTAEDIQSFLDELNQAYPPAELTMKDVLYTYGGLTPADDGEHGGEARRVRRSEIIDHTRTDRLKGLVSVVGVKYTTARLLAEKTVDIVFRRMDKTPPTCTAKDTPLPGARGYGGKESLLRPELKARIEADAKTMLECYGTAYESVLECGESASVADTQSVFQCCACYGVRKEMAVSLEDMVFRRSDLAVRGKLTDGSLKWCADMMAAELGWSAAHKEAELEVVRARQPSFGSKDAPAERAASATRAEQ